MRGGSLGPPGYPNFDAYFHGFWGSWGPGSRGNRFPVSKSPIPPLETFVRPHLMGVFEKTQKNIRFFLVFVKFLHPLEAVEPWGCYSDLERKICRLLV